jgi:hypothetical protein
VSAMTGGWGMGRSELVGMRSMLGSRSWLVLIVALTAYGCSSSTSSDAGSGGPDASMTGVDATGAPDVGASDGATARDGNAPIDAASSDSGGGMDSSSTGDAASPVDGGSSVDASMDDSSSCAMLKGACTADTDCCQANGYAACFTNACCGGAGWKGCTQGSDCCSTMCMNGTCQ